MRYLLAILVPPLAVLLCGKPLQAFINLLIWAISIPLCAVGIGFLTIAAPVIHALLTVNSHLADKRTEKLISAVKTSRN